MRSKKLKLHSQDDVLSKKLPTLTFFYMHIICACPPGPPCVTIPVATNALKTEGVSMEVSHFRHKIDLGFFRFVVCFQI